MLVSPILPKLCLSIVAGILVLTKLHFCKGGAGPLKHCTWALSDDCTTTASLLSPPGTQSAFLFIWTSTSLMTRLRSLPFHTNVTCNATSRGIARDAFIENSFGSSSSLSARCMSFCSWRNKKGLNAAETILCSAYVSLVDLSAAITIKPYDSRLSHKGAGHCNPVLNAHHVASPSYLFLALLPSHCR